jgi:2-amino-4-hydroxy-6-hydroxymethyldihydropteridine diphosphokinase
MNDSNVNANVLFSLGANLGDRIGTLRHAAQLLAERAVSDLHASSLYETEPVGFTEQPAFVNIAVIGVTRLTADELFRICKAIERECGRTPRPRWHEREIDIDIILYGTSVLHDEDLHIPHPHAHERRFVLAPAAEIAPQMRHPVLNATIDELLRHCPDTSTVIKLQPFSSFLPAQQ